MSAQRARSAVAADHRSAHPHFPGVPWWGAVLLAITATAIGFAFDAGSGGKELSSVFASCYVIGCVGAVLVARHAAVFTAVIQPPLILFVSVPSAYFLFNTGQVSGLKDLAINCGYPLIERFPLMFFTSAGVLLIGLLRWYLGMSARRTTARPTEAQEQKPSLVAALTAKVSSLLAREPDVGDAEVDDEDAEPPRRKRSAERSRPADARSSKSSSGRTGRSPSRGATSRSRHLRPPDTELIEPVVERPRRRRSTQGEPPPEPRRRPRPAKPRQFDVPSSERRAGYERPEHRRRLDDYQPREPHGRNGNGTHHPISRVRYRGEETDDRAEYRTRRHARDWEADSWEYDI